MTRAGGILDYKGGSNTYDGHAGTDYNANYVDFYAAADGVVEASVDNYGGRPSWCPSWAAWNVPERYVIIRHSNGYRTKYWHLSARAVNQGDSVHQGDRIGTTGNSGCSSGPHAHFEVSDTSNTPTDPYGYCANPNRSDPWKVADYWLWGDATSPCAQQNPGDGGGQSCTTLVDDSCSNFTAAGNPAGWHIQSGYTSIGGSFHWTQNSPDPSGTDHDNATWRPTLPQRGYYDVWVNITSNYATTTNAQYWVHYSGGGAVKIVVNQNASTGWVKLGNWLFETDGSSYVYLDDVTGEPYLSTYLDADAVEWRYTGPAVTLSSIAVSPLNATINKGATRQYTATGAYSDGHTQDLTGSVSWTSSNSSVASISSSGLATALNSGSTQITATRDGISGTTSLNVGTGTAPTYNTRLSTARGFDTCSAPGLAQLQNWWSSSPYRDVNIYIGGSSRACSQPNLNASWVSQASAMGWGLIPTWVGPQAPCTGFTSKLSSDPTTAGQQGIAEANVASDAAAALALTKTIIFYDMEQYSTGGGCSAAVQAFVNGWSQQLYARGNLPGVYGSPYAAEADWHNVIATPPYAVWIAQWICANQNDDACYATYTPSVYGIAPLNDANWSGHQRIHQYRGGHNESYGGVALNIDLDIEDTQVAVAAAASSNPLIVTQATDTGNVNQPGSLSTALSSAGNGDKIQFNLPAGQSTITVKGALPPLKKGAAIQGLCGPNGPAITLVGSDPAAPASGLPLSGNNTLYGLAIRQFRGKQLDLNGTTGNYLQCVRLSKS